MRLILFDIDGTLIFAHGVGRRALTTAMQLVYGTAPVYEDYDTRGRTDLEIVHDVMRAAGVPDEVIREHLPACFDTYVRQVTGLIQDGHPVQTMPGIPELIRALAAREDALVGLLTGNIAGGARAKLRPTGLLPYFRVGAYGSDDANRRRLPFVARERAHALTGREFAFRDLVIIGDTPLDVDCARSCGARAVAVGTGQHSLAELAACGPDLLFRDFADVNAVVTALTGR